MACPAKINRRYQTRDEARGYLASRGFSCGLMGWRNGRWMARIGRDGGGFNLEVWLALPPAVAPCRRAANEDEQSLYVSPIRQNASDGTGE
jgi:hypothetical protein